MKKIFLYSAVAFLSLASCEDENKVSVYKAPADITIQNQYDDEAIQKFLDNNYLDEKGNVTPFNSYDTSDDNYPSLNSMKHVLSSGVVYIMREGAQPDPGTEIQSDDILSIMMRAKSFIATNQNNSINFNYETNFYNTIDETGSPLVDPMFYYVTQEKMDEIGNENRSFYEIEGFREAIQKFRAFNKSADENYNLQGVIIVPSRAAFARDEHYKYKNLSFKDASFVFNFQIYKTTPRQ